MKVFLVLIISLPTFGLAAQSSNVSSKLNEKLFSHLIDQNFSKIIGVAPNSTIGNFASLNLEDSKIDLSGNILIKPDADLKTSDKILNFKFSAGITEGVSTILSGGKLSSKFGGAFSYNSIVGNPKLSFSTKSKHDYDQMVTDIEDEYDLAIREVQNETKKNKLILDSLNNFKILQKKSDSLLLVQTDRYLRITEAESKKIDEYSQIIEELEKALRISKNAVEAYTIKSKLNDFQKKKEKIRNEVKKRTDNQKNSVLRLSNELSTLNHKQQKFRNEIEKENKHSVSKRVLWLENERDKKLIELEFDNEKNKIEVNGFKIHWITFNASLDQKSFKVANSLLPFNEQVSIDTSFVSYSIGIQHSYYRKSKLNQESFYINSGILFSIGDNLSSVTKSEFKQIMPLDTIRPTQSFKESANTIFDLNEYENNLFSLSVYSNIYWFLFEKTIAAFHLFPEINFTKNREPSINIGLGYMTTLTDGEKKSPINLEIYYRFNDILNLNEPKNTLFKRGELGIQLNFPFNFKQSKHAKKESNSK